MPIYRLRSAQHLSVSLDEAWRFFSDPRNLAVITPPDMQFALTCDPPEVVYPGLILTYRLRPLLGIPTTWVTEITHVQEHVRFVDEQRVGPYSLWHHEHTFEAISGGTAIADDVWYSLPFGLLGAITHAALVRGRLRNIFAFRRRVLAERFGQLPGSPGARALPLQARG